MIGKDKDRYIQSQKTACLTSSQPLSKLAERMKENATTLRF
jgi:hypothetical protein